MNLVWGFEFNIFSRYSRGELRGLLYKWVCGLKVRVNWKIILIFFSIYILIKVLGREKRKEKKKIKVKFLIVLIIKVWIKGDDFKGE